MPYKELTTTPEQSRNKNTTVSTVPGNAKTHTDFQTMLILAQWKYTHNDMISNNVRTVTQ